ncbi:MAG: phenylalanine--tRNA ligase subunit beta, partial [Anaerofustis stercorihominis]
MLVPINWLKEYVNIDKDIKEFADMMTMSGSMVETVTYLGEGIENVVTAKINKITPHENAQKLIICTMFDGKEEYQVVTGANNVSEGDIV